MNKTFDFMIDKILIEGNEKHANMYMRGLAEMKKTLINHDLTLTKETNYHELYDFVFDNMKDDDLFEELNPNGGRYGGMYSVKGGNFTYCFWLYMSSVIRSQNPSNIDVWENFANGLNSRMYNFNTPAHYLASETAQTNKMPIAKLFVDCGLFNTREVQIILIHFMEADTFLHAIISPKESESLYRVLQRFHNIVRMSYETWVQLGHIFYEIRKIYEMYGRKLSHDLKQVRESLLFGSDIDETFKYLSRYVHGMISEIQQADDDFEDMYDPKVAGSVIVEFIVAMKPELAEIFDSNFSPKEISLPLDELKMKLLLLCQETMNEDRYGYYDYGSFYNAHTIYAGQPDPDHELSFEFRKSLHGDLYVASVGGYTAALERHGLILPV